MCAAALPGAIAVLAQEVNLTSASHPQSLLGLALALALCCLGLPASVAAGPAAQKEQAPNYRETTDQQLTALAARWDDLSALERRALLSEVKLRMVRQQHAQAGAPSGVLHIRLTPRFGAGRNSSAKGQLHIQLQTSRQGARVRALCQGPLGSCPEGRRQGAATPVFDERQQEQKEQPKYGVGFERRTDHKPAMKGKQAPKKFTIRAADSG